MSIVRTLAAVEPTRSQPPVGSGVFPGYVGPFGPTGAPSPVTEITSLRYPAVYAAVRVISESVAQLPLLTYQRTANGDRDRLQDDADPRVRMLRLQPNPWMTAFEMWESTLGVLNLLGNAYLYKERDAQGRVKALWPLPPQVTQTLRDVDGTLWYYVVPGPVWGPAGLDDSLYHSDDVIHLRGFGLDGWMGLSPITLHRRAIAIGSNADDMAEKFATNGGVPGGVLTTDNPISDTAFARLKEQWEATHVGVGNAHRVAILENGLKWQNVTLSQADSQFLQSREFQVTEIARIFNVPPHKIMDLSHATFSNIEQQSLDFVMNTVQPWLVRIEQRICAEVFDSVRDTGLFAEFLVDSLLRADITSRYTAFAQAPWMTDNEKRRKENLPAIEGLDEPLRPLNMTTASAAQDDTEQRVQMFVAMVRGGAVTPLDALKAVGLTDLLAEPDSLDPTVTPQAAEEEPTP